jgi:general secretion pathway protein D
MNRRKMKWVLPVSLSVLLCVASHKADARNQDSAKKLYDAGQLAEAKDDVITAYEDYLQAFKKNPKDLRYKTAWQRTRFAAAAAHVSRGEKLREQGDNSEALTEFVHALDIDPSNEVARQDIQEIRKKLSIPFPDKEISVSPDEQSKVSAMGGPVLLKPIASEPLTLQMTEDSKIVYETVGKASGINVLFDPEYTSKRIQVSLANVSLPDALRILATVSGTFWHAITPNTIFVAADTRAKRQQLEDQAVQAFYLSNVSQQNDLNDIQTALRNLLPNAKLYGVPSQNAIVMRGTPDELLLSRRLIEDLDKPRPEVVVDVSLIEVDRDRTRTIGLELPGSFGIALQPPNATSTTSSTTTTGTTSTTSGTSQNLTLNNLANLNGTEFAVTVGAATANLLLTDSNTKVLQNPTVRATDGQKADLKVGERIPVATGSYQTGAATAVVSSLVNTQFTYLDVGVEVEITPTVHFNGDVTLKTKIVTSEEQSPVTIAGITEPVISQRTSEQTVRLKEGETNIMGGFLEKEDLVSVAGTPGLGEVPLLKYIFSSQTHEVVDDEIMFLVTPHVVRAQSLNPLNLGAVDTGTGSNIELRFVDSQGSGQASASPVLQVLPTVNSTRVGSSAAIVPSQAQPSPPSPAAGTASAETAIGMQIVPPAAPPKAGNTFQVAVRLTGGQDVFSLPIMMHYDSSKLSLINVDTGDFFGRDGQTVALTHRDDGNGALVIASSRPPGMAGVSGGGTVCILTFKAKAAGDVSITLVRAAAKNSAQQSTEIAGSQAWVHISQEVVK